MDQQTTYTMSQVWNEPGMHRSCEWLHIVDLTFGPDGTLYVVEIDDASWAAVEFDLGAVGGTVNKCDPSTGSCT